MVFSKWGGRPHWEYDARVLGSDEHGTWLGVPHATPMSRPGAAFESSGDQVVLVPETAGFVATFFVRESTAPCDVYVDITTVPVVDLDRITTVDLDLDVLRGWTGRVWVDDEDEFADHRVRLGYPPEVVTGAVATCERVRRSVELRQPPFDDATPQRWLAALRAVMM
jgi:protein associated with RNAse G/E